MTPRPLTSGQTIAIGSLAVGVLDILKPILFLSFKGISATRIFQSIARGVLGRDAFQGGLPTAALGAFLHFFIAFGAFTTYYMVSRKVPILVRHALILGPLYGIAVYSFMQFVVFPLSAIGPVPHPMPVLVDGILTHIICVGLPTGIVIHEAARRNTLATR